MIRLIKYCYSFSKLPFSKQSIIIRITMILFYVKLLVTFIPLRYYYKRYFHEKSEQPIDLQLYINDVRLIKRIISIFPLRITCLMESLGVHIFFTQKKLYTPINLGICIRDTLSAHAWNADFDQAHFQKLTIK